MGRESLILPLSPAGSELEKARGVLGVGRENVPTHRKAHWLGVCILSPSLPPLSFVS